MSSECTLSRPWLHLDVRSMNITYRESRQVTLSDSDSQLNVLVSVPNIQTALTHAYCRLTAAWNCEPGTPYCPDCFCIFDMSTSLSQCFAACFYSMHHMSEEKDYKSKFVSNQ